MIQLPRVNPFSGPTESSDFLAEMLGRADVTGHANLALYHRANQPRTCVRYLRYVASRQLCEYDLPCAAYLVSVTAQCWVLLHWQSTAEIPSDVSYWALSDGLI